MTILEDLKKAEQQKYRHLMPGRCSGCAQRVVLAFNPMRWADPERALRAHECRGLAALLNARELIAKSKSAEMRALLRDVDAEITERQSRRGAK